MKRSILPWAIDMGMAMKMGRWERPAAEPNLERIFKRQASLWICFFCLCSWLGLHIRRRTYLSLALSPYFRSRRPFVRPFSVKI